MELRDIEILLTLADELHFGRTAERLHLSQARISQSIKRQERHMGGRLVDRSNPRRIALTPLGMQLINDLRPPYGALVRAIESARRTANGDSGVLRLGFLAGTTADESTARIIDSFRQRRPGWRVELHQADFSHPTAGLATGQADVGLLRVPFPGQEKYRVEVIRTEPRCVALPTSHELTAAKRIPFADLWHEPFVALPAVTDSWRDHWLAVDSRDGHPVKVSAEARSPEEFLAAIANGYGISLAPAVAERFYQHPGVQYRPVDGVSPSQVAVVWKPGDDNPVLSDFVDACREHRTHNDSPVGVAPAARSPGATAGVPG